MNEKKEFLTEENYEKGKKKITLPVKIIIIGFIIGILVAGVGGIKQVNVNKTNKERKQEALNESKEAVKKANARLKEIDKEYEEVEAQYNAKSDECDEINNNMLASDWYTKSTKCQREKSSLNSKLSDLESESNTIKNKDYTVYYQLVKPMTYQIFYIIGSSIFGASLLGAFIIYLVKGKKTY